jgi:hypothetical protein
MDLTRGILKQVAQMGQALALLAALFLAANPHSLHAQADDRTGRSHLGSFCEALDTEKSSPDGDVGAQSSHGDCLHHFDPMIRTAVEHHAIDVSAAEAGPKVEPVRRLNLTLDPPPPRNPS